MCVCVLGGGGGGRKKKRREKKQIKSFKGKQKRLHF